MSVYLTYKIGYYTIQQVQTSSYMATIYSSNERTLVRNKEKEFLALYIQTRAYQTQIAKATQNKKLPKEEVINIIAPGAIEGNRDRESASVIQAAQQSEDNPTKNMNTPEKWWYLIKQGI
jgi:hypothetical protein